MRGFTVVGQFVMERAVSAIAYCSPVGTHSRRENIETDDTKWNVNLAVRPSTRTQVNQLP